MHRNTSAHQLALTGDLRGLGLQLVRPVVIRRGGPSAVLQHLLNDLAQVSGGAFRAQPAKVLALRVMHVGPLDALYDALREAVRLSGRDLPSQVFAERMQRLADDLASVVAEGSAACHPIKVAQVDTQVHLMMQMDADALGLSCKLRAMMCQVLRDLLGWPMVDAFVKCHRSLLYGCDLGTLQLYLPLGTICEGGAGLDGLRLSLPRELVLAPLELRVVPAEGA